MNDLEIPADWNQQKERLKERFALLGSSGPSEKLYKMLQSKFGKTKEEIQEIIKTL